MRGTTGVGRGVFDRGLGVLSAVADLGSVSAADIASRTGLPVSTTYRYLNSLVVAGLVSSKGGMFALGERLDLRSEPGVQSRFRDAYREIMHGVAFRTRETVLLTTRVHLSALVVYSVDSPQCMRMSFNVGNLMALYAGASAKTLLAYAPRGVQESVFAASWEKFASNTPTKETLRKQLPVIRSQGYCVTASEVDECAVAVGVPVHLGGEVTHALSIAAPAHRAAADSIPRWISMLNSAAAGMAAG